MNFTEKMFGKIAISSKTGELVGRIHCIDIKVDDRDGLTGKIYFYETDEEGTTMSHFLSIEKAEGAVYKVDDYVRFDVTPCRSTEEQTKYGTVLSAHYDGCRKLWYYKVAYNDGKEGIVLEPEILRKNINIKDFSSDFRLQAAQ